MTEIDEKAKCLNNLMDDLEIILLRFGWCTRNTNIYMHAHVRCLVLSRVVSSPNGVVRAIRAVIILLLLQIEDNICVTGFCFVFFYCSSVCDAHTFVECFI